MREIRAFILGAGSMLIAAAVVNHQKKLVTQERIDFIMELIRLSKES